MTLASFAQGSQHGLYLVDESVAGTTPATPAWTPIRHNSCNLGLKRTKISSAEVRNDRAMADVRLGNYNISGSIGIELSYGGAMDTMIEAALGGTWAVAYNLATQTIAIDKDAKTLTRGAGSWITDGVKVGDTFILAGSTTGANNGNYLISNVTALALTYTQGPATTTEAGSGTQTATTNRYVVKQGTTIHSLSMLRRFSDITQYEVFSGCRVDKMNFSVKPNAVVTGSFDIVGIGIDASLPAGSTYSNPTTTSNMDNFSAAALEAGSPIGLITSIDITLDNGMAAMFVVGAKPAANILWGRSVASGKATMLFNDMTMFNKFVNETASSIVVTFADRAGNSYRISMMNVVYTTGDQNVSGEKEIPLDMGYDALHHTTYTNMQWERIPVYAAA